jgi:thiol-disulfide isomerase/thioredoxin
MRFLWLVGLVVLVVLDKAIGVEDVTAKQLEAVVTTEDFVAVYWYTKNCKTCERALSVLERGTDEVTEAGVSIVKINDKKTAKEYGIRNFPALSFFRGGDPVLFEGDLMNSEEIVEFLASPSSQDLPNKIEDVSASQLEALVHDKTYVAVFFYDKKDKQSNKALTALETIDDDFDVHNIIMLKMSDTSEARQYGVKDFPSLILFVDKIPELYEGDLTDANNVLEWVFSQTGIELPKKQEEEEEQPEATPPPKPAKKPKKSENPKPLIKETPKPVKLRKPDTETKAKPEKVSKPTKEPKPTPIEEPEIEKVDPQIEKIAEEPVADRNPAEEDANDEAPENMIKNGNNVVAFFSGIDQATRRKNATIERNNHQVFFDWVKQTKANVLDMEQSHLDSCWLLPCASAKKSRTSLNIHKLEAVPL